jgi:hypothetical protein
MAAHSSMARSLCALALIAAAVAGLAWVPRSVDGMRHPYERGAGDWFSRDPDGLYHARRVERAMAEGFTVAGTDPRMDFPHGARIPWPPYYDLGVSLALAPFTPGDPAERWRFIERAVASLPRLFGVAAAVVAAVAAWRLGGPIAASAAGVTCALCRGTINYAVIGTGDHHAWIALLAALLVFGASEAFRRGALDTPRRGALWGLALGAVAGLMIGSWVASLLYVLEVELALAWLIVRRGRAELPGLAPLGLAFHLAALAVLAPAVMESPWREEFPWMVVNLSWFHAATLALGAAVFAPLAALGRGFFAAGTVPARLYAPGVAVALGALALACWLLDLAPARGIADGFAWVSRADTFMDTVQESAPLAGARAERGVLFLALGYGILALPIAWAAIAWRALRRDAHELLPWAVAVALLLPQALQQRRFADPLAVPMAVALGWGAAELARVGRRAWIGPALVALAALSQYPAARSAARQLSGAGREWAGTQLDPEVGARRAFEWIRARGDGSDEWSVLAHWDRGHVIEWVAASPSVSTNFGSYVGIESYRDPSAFFVGEDPEQAEALLARRRTRFVFAPSSMPQTLASMLRVAAPERHAMYLSSRPGGGAGVTERWYATMGARLLFDGFARAPSGAWVGPDRDALGFLRLVHVTPYFDARVIHPFTKQPSPAAYVWERVAGAWIEAIGSFGEALEVAVEIEFPSSGYRTTPHWSARADRDGAARVRVPYSTEAGANGDARVLSARWSIGRRSGTLAVPESAVQAGATVRAE